MFRFSRGEVVFYRLEIKSKNTNVVNTDEKVKEGCQDICGRYRKNNPTWEELKSPSPERDSEAMTAVWGCGAD
ncbi:hypothetical protein E2C01_062419 [Portunus trituberculatus]|uniref:Uncharacterized protein n=1 Tax=Portunus trituberculatus TaxID=210409 RepID=A0A5B7HB19_PORTR|nr:hypothetical protein [Portunus trituberculatus]